MKSFSLCPWKHCWFFLEHIAIFTLNNEPRRSIYSSAIVFLYLCKCAVKKWPLIQKSTIPKLFQLSYIMSKTTWSCTTKEISLIHPITNLIGSLSVITNQANIIRISSYTRQNLQSVWCTEINTMKSYAASVMSSLYWYGAIQQYINS